MLVEDDYDEDEYEHGEEEEGGKEEMEMEEPNLGGQIANASKYDKGKEVELPDPKTPSAMDELASMFTPEQLATTSKVIQAMNASASGSETKRRKKPPGNHSPLRIMNPLTPGEGLRGIEGGGPEEQISEGKGDPRARYRKTPRKPPTNNTWSRVPKQQTATPTTPKGV